MKIKNNLKINVIWTDLLTALVMRELRGRYTRSFLGPLWAILQPLMLMVVFTIVRNILNISSDGSPYIIFSYAALVPFTFFSTATKGASSSIFSAATILKKMYVPREIFPAVSVLIALVDFGISFIILLGMMMFYQIPLTIHLLWLPVLVFLTALLAWGIGIGVAALGTFRRDFILGLTFGLQLLTYATPIIYPLSSVPEKWRNLYSLNPLVGLIENYRHIIINGRAPDFELLLITTIVTFLVCAVSWPLFRITSQYFADVL